MSLTNTQVVTGEVRLSYPALFEPTKIGESDQEPRYRVTIIIPKTDTKTINAIKAAIQKAAENGAAKHFGGRVPTVIPSTLKDGDTETDDIGESVLTKHPYYKGCMYMKLSTKFRPKVLDVNRNEVIDPTVVYAGCYGRVSLTCFAYSNNGKRGVSAALNNVLITRDGEPLGTHLSGDEFDD